MALNYDEFVKRKHVTKAIRFELIPQGNTQKYIDEHGDVEYDKALYNALDQIKPIVDSFIRFVTSEALSNIDYDFNALKEAKEQDRKAFDKESKNLLKIIDKNVSDVMPDEMKVSQINSAKFLQEVLRDYVLNTKDSSIKKDEAIKNLETTKGCLALCSKFLTSRITALTTWMPERVLENFDIYCANIKNIEAVKESGEFNDLDDVLEKMSSVSYYMFVLTQDAINGYNQVISGVVTENGTAEKGLNQRINEYNTKIKTEKIDKPFLKLIKPLNKQILVPQEKSFKIESIKSDDEVRTVIKEAWNSFNDETSKMQQLLASKLQESDGTGVFVKGNRVHQLSHLLTGSHQIITDVLVSNEIDNINSMLATDGLKPALKRELNKQLDNINKVVSSKDYEIVKFNNVLDSDKTTFALYVGKFINTFNLAQVSYKVLESSNILGKKRIKGDRNMQEIILDFFESLTNVREILRIIVLPEDADGDIAFYNEFNELNEKIRLSYKAENLVRNYITKSEKDLAVSKQTCFGTPARLRCMWWNGEKKFSKDMASIIKHEDKYYYFILSGDAKPVTIIEDNNSNTGFITLKKGQKSFMMLPKILFTDHAVPYFDENQNAAEYILNDEQVTNPVTVTKTVYDIYKNGLFKRDTVNDGRITEDEYKANIAALIDTYKEFANAYVQYVKFDLTQLNDTESYSDIGEFFSDVDIYTSNLSWTYIDFKQIENLVECGEGYLFLINNKFIYSGRADKNLYTKTFLSILSEENMKRTTVLLNSGPAIFFRPQSMEYAVTHKKGSVLVNHLTSDGKHIPNDIYETIYKIKNNFTNIDEADYKVAIEYMNTNDVVSFKADKDISRQRKYMMDKYILQLTYTKNNDVSDRFNDSLNDRVLDAIKDGCNIVSVSRSLNDLVYVMATDKDYNVLEERSLNVIDGIDYHELLEDACNTKADNKKAWIYNTSAAGLKEAYIDFAITEILKLAKKYNAVIVVENIGKSTKDKWNYLDNQVFKRFETRLAERLADFALKDIPNGTIGSVSNPLQLANNNGNTYQDGILFYVNGAYTRNVDPITGFTSLFDFGKIHSIQAKRQFFAKMDKIELIDGKFEFSFDYNNFDIKYDIKKTDWKVIVGGDAVVFDKENKKNIVINDIVTENILPTTNGADISGNLVDKILSKELPGAFIDELYKWFRYDLAGTHKKTKNSNEFYRSPITLKENAINHNSCYNLARKFNYRLEYDEKNDEFTSNWLNYIES